MPEPSIAQNEERQTTDYKDSMKFIEFRKVNDSVSSTSTAKTYEAVPGQPDIVEIPVIRQKRVPKGYFKGLNLWEGTVLECNDMEFRAELRDRDNPNAPDEIVEFDIDEISDASDRKLIKPGAIFYFSIGYKFNEYGTKEGSYQIMFRRMPYWTDKQLKNIQEEASRIAASLRTE